METTPCTYKYKDKPFSHNVPSQKTKTSTYGKIGDSGWICKKLVELGSAAVPVQSLPPAPDLFPFLARVASQRRCRDTFSSFG